MSLCENGLGDRESFNYLVKGLIDNPEGSKLIELDLSKNRITSESVEPFVQLFEKNVKLRNLNLKNNIITDEGASLLVQAIINNEYITKFSLEFNPLRHSVLADIEKHTRANQLKVNEQEVPQMIEEILEVKKKTA